MSTSDQQDHGPLTRKQLREIRLTGSTPVITPEEAAAAAEAAPPAPPLPQTLESTDAAPDPAAVSPEPTSLEPALEEPASEDPSPEEAAPEEPTAEEPTAGTAAFEEPVSDEHASEPGEARLTRRQVREQERLRTASVPVIGADDGASTESQDATADVPVEATIEPDAVDSPATPSTAADAQSIDEAPAIVSGLPAFSPAVPDDTAGDDDDIDDEIVIEPVRASDAADSVGVVPLEVIDEAPHTDDDDDDVVAVLGLSGDAATDRRSTEDDVLADVEDTDDDDVVADPRPTVNPAFGEGLLADAPDPRSPFRPSFDELLSVGDSTGSQHSAPNALIFTPSPGEGSLSGPVASTGEILVTGSYELPQGLGSQGHAHGTTDGKDVDAVLIDGELAPASSPTPIAASAAVSTIKPAGEIIRPPAPDKGNKLMMILAIVAGGLALALGVALIFAFTTNVF